MNQSNLDKNYINSLNIIQLKLKSIDRLLTIIRDINLDRQKFIEYSNRLLTIVSEEALSYLPTTELVVETPFEKFYGNQIPSSEDICGVSIMRSGDILLDALHQIEPKISIGKILVQRDEDSINKEATFYYCKLPENISQMYVLVCDPLLATGGSAICAINVLLKHHVPIDKIYFVNLISAPEGLEALLKKFPEIKIITACIDSHLNQDKFVVPGLGDFGDRYYNTK